MGVFWGGGHIAHLRLLVKTTWRSLSLSFSCFPIPLILFALLFSLHPSSSSDPGSRSRLSYPPPPSPLLAVRALPFYREKTAALSSLADSRLLVPTYEGALSNWSLFIFASKVQISPRRDSNSGASAITGGRSK